MAGLFIRLIKNPYFWFKFIYLILFFLAGCQTGVDDFKSSLPANTNQNNLQSYSSQKMNNDDSNRHEAIRITKLSTSVYEVVESMQVVNQGPGQPDKFNLWVALIRDIPPYKEVIEQQVLPDDYVIITDEYGNQYAEFDFSKMPANTTIPILIKYKVRVNQLIYEMGVCKGKLPNFFTKAELRIESKNQQIIDLAESLSKGKDTACDQIEAFYNYIGDTLVYTYNGRNWGAQAALGEMGADCTEFASLMAALSRASRIPARYVEGLYLAGNGRESIARTEHAWLEVYLPQLGWTPMDPTIGRTAANRDKYFAAMPADHIIVTQGRNPSTLRGGNYWTYLYWPGSSADVRIEDFMWSIVRIE